MLRAALSCLWSSGCCPQGRPFWPGRYLTLAAPPGRGALLLLQVEDRICPRCRLPGLLGWPSAQESAGCVPRARELDLQLRVTLQRPPCSWAPPWGARAGGRQVPVRAGPSVLLGPIPGASGSLRLCSSLKCRSCLVTPWPACLEVRAPSRLSSGPWRPLLLPAPAPRAS